MLICAESAAAPRLAVSMAGPNAEGNVEWLVQAAPDPALFTDTGQGFGGSLDVELGFQVASGSLAQAASHPAWHEIPGYNPFMGEVTLGVHADTSKDVVFAALGSDVFTSGEFVNLLTIETPANATTTLVWGGQVHWPGLPFEFVGGRITQGGISFDAFRGSRTWAPNAQGDYNGSGLVEQADMDLVLTNWGRPAEPPPAGWVADLPSGTIDQAELDGLLINWGKTTVPTAVSQAVPEPSAGLLLASSVVAAIAVLRCTRTAVDA